MSPIQNERREETKMFNIYFTKVLQNELKGEEKTHEMHK